MMGKTHVVGGAFATSSGLLAARATGVNLSNELVVVGTLIGMFAAELPDIDHSSSRVSRAGNTGYLPFSFLEHLGAILLFPAQILGVIIRGRWNHRGPTHSLAFAVIWMAVVVPLYGAFLFCLTWVFVVLLRPFLGSATASMLRMGGVRSDWMTLPAVHVAAMSKNLVFSHAGIIIASVGLGYLSHLVLDGCTKVPVLLYWPFSDKRVSLLPAALRIQTDSPCEKGFIRPGLFVLTIVVVGVFVAFPLIRQRTERVSLTKQAATMKREIQQGLQFTTNATNRTCQSKGNFRYECEREQ